MANQAEGGSDGIVAAGPDNKFDGVGAHPEVDNCAPQSIMANIRNRMPWKTGQSTPAASGFALGSDRPT